MNAARIPPRRIAIFAAAVLAAAAPLKNAGAAAEPLAPPAGNVETARFFAEGTQNYIAVPRADDPAKFQWTLKAPDARLYNAAGKFVGTHYAGPTWESVKGSKVIAARVDSMDSPDPNAIAWLLLKGVDHEGNGVFGSVTYIQRINTQGGKAPAAPPTAAGQEASIPYTAAYVFFEAAE